MDTVKLYPGLLQILQWNKTKVYINKNMNLYFSAIQIAHLSGAPERVIDKSGDPDQSPTNVASDQGLHSLQTV